MTNTIPNVARTMKKCAACRTEKPVSEMKTCMHNQMHNYVCDSKCMHDFYNPPKTKVAPSPAGVDGLEVIGWYTDDHLDDKSATTYSREVADRWLAKGWPVTGIANASDAQAIIDGLLGENEALHDQVKVLQSDANSWQSGYDEGRRMGGKAPAPGGDT